NAERKKTAGNGKQQPLQVREVFISDQARSLPNPDVNPAPRAKGQPALTGMQAKALGGPTIKVEKGKDARVELFEWMHAPDNPFFAWSFVNRFWGHYFGVGLFEPVDDFSLANPPTNAKLLDMLAKDFIDHKYDLRYLEAVILTSRVYQLSSRTNATNKYDRNN